MSSTSHVQPGLLASPDVEIDWDASVPVRDRAGSEPAVWAFVAEHVPPGPMTRGARVRVCVASSNGQLRIRME